MVITDEVGSVIVGCCMGLLVGLVAGPVFQTACFASGPSYVWLIVVLVAGFVGGLVGYVTRHDIGEFYD